MTESDTWTSMGLGVTSGVFASVSLLTLADYVSTKAILLYNQLEGVSDVTPEALQEAVGAVGKAMDGTSPIEGIVYAALAGVAGISAIYKAGLGVRDGDE